MHFLKYRQYENNFRKSIYMPFYTIVIETLRLKHYGLGISSHPYKI